MLSIIKKSWRDFFSFKMLALNFLPIIISLFLWGSILFYFSNEIFSYLAHFLPTSWQNFYENHGIFARVANIFITLFLYTLLVFFILLLTLISNVFISIFYAPLVIIHLHKKYYDKISLDSFGGFITSIKHFGKSFLWLIFFVIIFVPLYFIPFVGFLAIIVPHFFFFKNMMFFDLGSYIFTQTQYQACLRHYKGKNFQITLIAYAFSFIPIFNLFATLLQTIILSRYLLEIKNTQHIFSDKPA